MYLWSFVVGNAPIRQSFHTSFRRLSLFPNVRCSFTFSYIVCTLANAYCSPLSSPTCTMYSPHLSYFRLPFIFRGRFYAHMHAQSTMQHTDTLHFYTHTQRHVTASVSLAYTRFADFFYRKIPFCRRWGCLQRFSSSHRCRIHNYGRLCRGRREGQTKPGHFAGRTTVKWPDSKLTNRQQNWSSQ